LDLKLAKVPLESQYDDARNQWYSRLFNTLNWLSFMINEKMITDNKLIQHMRPVITRYYEDMFVKNVSVEERDSKFYQEFTKLYQTIKEIGILKFGLSICASTERYLFSNIR
jgi:hypothetical protein